MHRLHPLNYCLHYLPLRVTTELHQRGVREWILNLHIYGGDFFDTTRSQWNPETLDEEPSDGARIREMFRRENQRLGLN